jgi:flagellar hook-associated protein 1 FlgK
MSVLNIGTRALTANQVALQTVGNNIANVDTPGYSRQKAVFTAVEGQYTGAGYVGKGVEVKTIQRTYDEFLTRQSNISSANASADAARVTKLNQLQDIFTGGTSGLGAAISDMMNSFSDVASAPTDLTARTVALTRIDETANRFRATSQALDDLQNGMKQELNQKADAINSLAKNIAAVNVEIARGQGTGQLPNDLLDRRDQLIHDLNQYVQTTPIPAEDGTIGLLLAGSQSLVLGGNMSPVSIISDDYGDPFKSKLAIDSNGQIRPLDESVMGGGEIAGLLRFQNNDLIEGRNLLGRLTTAITLEMNAQHALGLDLDGNPGAKLFTVPDLNTVANIRVPESPAKVNSNPNVSVTLAITDDTKLAASDYTINFSTPSSGSIVRLSDGTVTPFTMTDGSSLIANIDGLTLEMPSALTDPAEKPIGGDRFLIKPFCTSASNVAREFSNIRQLAVASPIAGAMGTANRGSLQLVSLSALSNVQPSPEGKYPVVLTFTSATTYTRSDEVDIDGNPTPNATELTFEPNTPITGLSPDANWSLKLSGVPQAGDSFQVIDVKDPDDQYNIDLKLNAGNATAMLGLRDKLMFDGGAMTDGFAGAISVIGIRTQSAGYAATVSSSIAASMEKDRSSVSGVNLDEEAAQLIQYQQAYQAASKMIQIAQNIFDTLIQGLAR